jgi:hypothetical protein
MRFIKEDRHPEIPSMRARCLQRPNRGEGPFVSAGKHEVSQGYSPGDENAGSLMPFEMTFVNGLKKRKINRYRYPAPVPYIDR